MQQGPDGSVWQIKNGDGGPLDVVQYMYTPEGQVLVITPQSKTYTYAVRIKSIWAEVEYPALKANPNIKSITGINPEAGQEVLLWSR